VRVQNFSGYTLPTVLEKVVKKKKVLCRAGKLNLVLWTFTLWLNKYIDPATWLASVHLVRRYWKG
jgi:hypothetical protein